MNSSLTMRCATSLFMLAGLLGGGVTSAVAQQEAPRAVAANAAPPMNRSCHKAFRKDLKQLHNEGAAIWAYYQGWRKSVKNDYDLLLKALADPDQGGIPALEESFATSVSLVRPIVAKQRDRAYKHLNNFEASFQDKDTGCLRTKNGRKALADGVRYWRAALGDIFTAHGYLFAANLAMQTAQAAEAAKKMQDAKLAMSTVEENIDNADRKFDTLLN